MVEVTSGTQGDAVSRMFQLEAKTLKIPGLKWTGKGHDDVRMILAELDSARTFKDALFRGINDLLHMTEMEQLPEAMQAKVAMIVLNARAEIDLKIIERAKLLQARAP